MTAAPLVFLDCETGGLRPNDRPWEIALVRRDDAGESVTLLHVTDFRPAGADPKALQLGGFYDRHVTHATNRNAAWKAAQAAVNEHRTDSFGLFLAEPEDRVAEAVEETVRGAVVVACNPGFDVPKLEALLNRHGLAWTAHYRSVCATTFAAGALGWAPPVSNEQVGAELGVQRNAHGTVHTGLADALYARDLFDAALVRASEQL